MLHFMPSGSIGFGVPDLRQNLSFDTRSMSGGFFIEVNSALAGLVLSRLYGLRSIVDV
jgi:hypothetical protein